MDINYGVSPIKAVADKVLAPRIAFLLLRMTWIFLLL